MLTIRPETEQDYDDIYNVVKEAFRTATHTNGDEQNLVTRLRANPAYIPELSLVARKDKVICGHIMFTEIKINEISELILAPLSVLPKYQKQGIGTALVSEGHRIARKLGYGFSVLVGHADYYPRFGYRPAYEFGLSSSIEVPSECFMVLNLQGNERKLNGILTYPDVFFPKK